MSTIFLGFAQSEAGEGEGEIEAGEWRRPAACLPDAIFLVSSRLVSSLGLAVRRLAEQDKEQVQVQGAGGLQNGRSKGELAARWLERIET